MLLIQTKKTKVVVQIRVWSTIDTQTEEKLNLTLLTKGSICNCRDYMKDIYIWNLPESTIHLHLPESTIHLIGLKNGLVWSGLVWLNLNRFGD